MSAIIIAIHVLSFSRQVSDDLSHTVNSCAKLIRFYLFKQHHLISRVVDECHGRNQAEIVGYIQNKIPILDKGDHFLVLDKQLRVVGTSPHFEDQLIGLDLSGLKFLSSESQVSPIQQSFFSKDPVVLFKYYLPGSMILLVERDIKNLVPIIKSTTPKIEDVEIFVLSDRGTVVYHPNEEYITSRKNLKVEFQDWNGPDRYGLYHYRYGGASYWCSMKELDLPKGWTFYASISKTALIASAIQHLLPILSAMILVFVAMLLLFNLTIIRHLSRPVRAVAKRLEQAAPLERPAKFPEDLAAGTYELKLIIDRIEYLLRRVFTATQKIKVREELLSIVTEFGTDWAYWMDKDGKFLYVSSACQEITGYRPEEFIDHPALMTEIILPEDRPLFASHLEGSLGEIPHEPLEFRILTRNGRIRWIRHVCRKITDNNGNYLGVRGSNVDITRAKKAELLLAQERHRLATILDSIDDGVLALSKNQQIIFKNRAADTILSLSHHISAYNTLETARFGTDIVPENISPEDLKEIMELINTASSARKSWRLRRLIDIKVEDEIRKIQVVASPVLGEMPEERRDGQRDAGLTTEGLVLLFKDRTEEIKRQSEQSKLEKLQNLGLAAGGIAHDFNNLLTAILGNINLVHHQLEEGHPAAARIEAAEKACHRAQRLTQQLLTFAKGGEPVRKATSIPELIKETAEFVLTGKAVSCTFDFPEDLWLMNVDPGQVSQMIQNLVINAVQAMKGNGTLTVRARNVELSHEEADSGRVAGLSPGKYVKIEIEDSGPGIDEELMDKIFDPYFTTKEGGSGLGLSVCLSIATRHGGTILASSTPGKGSCFTIFLPAVLPSADQEATSSAAQPEDADLGDVAHTNGDNGDHDRHEESDHPDVSGRVLIMDDEPAIVELASEGLGAAGYQVETAHRGEEAIELYKQALEQGRPFDAVVLDLTIAGGMGGVETAKRLLAMDPHAVLIVSTGYSDEMVMKRPEELGFRFSLPKPYRLDQLKRLIDSIIMEKKREQ